MSLKTIIKKGINTNKENIELAKGSIQKLRELEKLIQEDKQAEEFLTFLYEIHKESMGGILEKYSLKFLEDKYREIRRKKSKLLKPYLDVLKRTISMYKKLPK